MFLFLHQDLISTCTAFLYLDPNQLRHINPKIKFTQSLSSPLTSIWTTYPPLVFIEIISFGENRRELLTYPFEKIELPHHFFYQRVRRPHAVTQSSYFVRSRNLKKVFFWKLLHFLKVTTHRRQRTLWYAPTTLSSQQGRLCRRDRCVPSTWIT